MERADNKKEIRCKKCNSTQTYIKFSTSERVCRSCGNVEKLNLKNIYVKGGKI